MRRVERQFLSMAVVMLLVVGVVMSINTVTMYNVRDFVHLAEVYFNCLQVRQLLRFYKQLNQRNFESDPHSVSLSKRGFFVYRPIMSQASIPSNDPRKTSVQS